MMCIFICTSEDVAIDPEEERAREMGTSAHLLSTYYEAGTVLTCFTYIITFGIQNNALVEDSTDLT